MGLKSKIAPNTTSTELIMDLLVNLSFRKIAASIAENMGVEEPRGTAVFACVKLKPTR